MRSRCAPRNSTHPSLCVQPCKSASSCSTSPHPTQGCTHRTHCHPPVGHPHQLHSQPQPTHFPWCPVLQTPPTPAPPLSGSACFASHSTPHLVKECAHCKRCQPHEVHSQLQPTYFSLSSALPTCPPSAHSTPHLVKEREHCEGCQPYEVHSQLQEHDVAGIGVPFVVDYSLQEYSREGKRLMEGDAMQGAGECLCSRAGKERV